MPFPPSSDESAPPIEPALVVAPGARVLEQALCRDVAQHLDALRRARRLDRPTWVVVASRSQREHVQAALLREGPGSRLGVVVKTLYQVAREVLGPRAPRADFLVETWIERAWRERALLRHVLEPFEDTEGLPSATVQDLLDAGVDAPVARNLESQLGDATAAAWASAAAWVQERCREAGIGGAGEAFAGAARHLEQGGRVHPEPAAVFVHGFAEATGRATRLLAALERRWPMRLYLDEPSDPTQPDRPDLGVRFVARLRARFEPRLPLQQEQPAPSDVPPTRYEAFRAAGTAGEVRELASRVREALDAGLAPERIAVVARRIAPYATAIRERFTEMGIPFSGGDRAELGPPLARRRAAWWRVMTGGAGASLDDLAEIDERGTRPERTRALTRAREKGARRLADLARPGGAGSGRGRSDRGRPPDGVRALLAALEDWPESAPPAEQLDRLERAADAVLVADSELDTALRTLCARGRDELPALPLARTEFLHAMERASRPWTSLPLGGAGAGVQVLDATEARSLCFARLFLLGVERQRFPRVIQEDPLLPDARRRPLRTLLPELPLKTEGHHEERWLFAHLCSSAPVVTVSHRVADDAGGECNPSPFLSGLPGIEDPHHAPQVPRHPLQALARGDGPRPIADALLHAALHGGIEEFARFLPEALRRAGEWLDAPVPGTPEERAPARSRALRAHDPGPVGRHGDGAALRPGPFQGVVGPPRADDRRLRPTFVTTLESLARCPYQMLLERVLGLAPPADPAGAPPEMDARVVGIAVHAALQRLIAPRTPAPGAGGPADPVPRPVPARVRAAIERAARDTAQGESIPWPGYARALARRIEGRVHAALDHTWAEQPPHVQACEQEFQIHLGAADGATDGAAKDTAAPEAPGLSFRADRVDAVPGDDGARLVLTDYKTGKPFSEHKTPEKRQAELLKAVRRGRALQGAAYARVAAKAEGRYLFLREPVDGAAEGPALEFRLSGAELDAAFQDTTAVLLDALQAGVLPPRVEDPRDPPRPKEPTACEYCEVRLACVRGDTGARQRLAALAAQHRAGPTEEAGRPPDPGAEAAALLSRLWYLGEAPPEAPPETPPDAEVEA